MSEDTSGMPQPLESAEAARERRLRALRELTRPATEGGQPGGQTSAAGVEQSREYPNVAAGATPLRPQRRRARAALWAGALVALCVVLIVAGAAYAGLIPGLSLNAKAAPPAIAMTSHDLRGANIACFQDNAWSPTGDRLAVLGYQGGCSTILQGGSSAVGMVVVYDTTTNRILTQFSPDSLVQPPANAVLQYQNILWSPDGQRLAVTFSTLTLEPAPGVNGPVLTPTGGGALFTDASGAHPQTLTVSAGQGNGAAAGTLEASGEWDVTTGKAITPPTITTSSVEYRWGANGALRPVNGAAPMVVGNPAGGQTFTVWQPGSTQLGIDFSNSNNPSTAHVISGLYVWNATFAAWSPDGRYFYTPFSVARRVTLPNQPAPNAQTLHTSGYDVYPTVAAHDRVFASLYLTLLQSANAANQSGVFPQIDVAWRLDGRVLAAQTFASDANGNVTPSFYTVTLYDTVTGRVLAHLSHDAHLAATADGAFGLVRWSPDGKHLALADSAFNTLTIWTFNKPLA